MNNIELRLIAERYFKTEILQKYIRNKGKKASHKTVCTMLDSCPSFLIRCDILR